MNKIETQLNIIRHLSQNIGRYKQMKWKMNEMKMFCREYM